MVSFTDGALAFTVDKNLAKQTTPRVLAFSFGDGYEQRLADGINVLGQTFTATFNTRTQSEIDSIDDFFETQQGVTAFAFHPPDLGETTQSITFSGSVATGTGFNSSIFSPSVPDRLVVTGSASNDGSFRFDTTATNNDTTATVVETFVGEGPTAGVTLSAGVSMIAVDWTKVYNYASFYSLVATFKRVHEA